MNLLAETIYVRTSAATARGWVRPIPSILRGGGAVADAVMVRCGLALLGRIRTAFVAKARGGTDEAGDSWPPLSPKTIAYSKTRQRGVGGRTRAERGRATRPSQALSQQQQDRWWQVYRQQMARFRGDRGKRGHAAAFAWLVLKGEGAQTLVDKYGHRKVEILIDTGLLVNSLSPGVRSGESVFRVGPGEVIVGTNRKGASAHHRGVPGRLPQRRLWPEPRKWPGTWWADITDQLRQGILDILAMVIGSNTK